MRAIRALIERAADGTGDGRRDRSGDRRPDDGHQFPALRQSLRPALPDRQHAPFDRGRAICFRRLPQQSEGYRQVAERLQAEHVVVHELLMRLVDALERAGGDADARQPLPMRARSMRRSSGCCSRTSATRKTRSATRSAISGSSGARTGRAARRAAFSLFRPRLLGFERRSTGAISSGPSAVGRADRLADRMILHRPRAAAARPACSASAASTSRGIEPVVDGVAAQDRRHAVIDRARFRGWARR